MGVQADVLGQICKFKRLSFTELSSCFASLDKSRDYG